MEGWGNKMTYVLVAVAFKGNPDRKKSNHTTPDVIFCLQTAPAVVQHASHHIRVTSLNNHHPLTSEITYYMQYR